MSNSEENITIDVWRELTIGFLIKKGYDIKKIHVSFVEQAIFCEESKYYYVSVLLIDHFKLL